MDRIDLLIKQSEYLLEEGIDPEIIPDLAFQAVDDILYIELHKKGAHNVRTRAN
jgi:hypothetical protein